MANLVIRPASGTGNKVVVQDQAGGAVLTTADSGATMASNVTGIPAAGVTGVLPAGVTGGAGLNFPVLGIQQAIMQGTQTVGTSLLDVTDGTTALAVTSTNTNATKFFITAMTYLGGNADVGTHFELWSSIDGGSYSKLDAAHSSYGGGVSAAGNTKDFMFAAAGDNDSWNLYIGTHCSGSFLWTPGSFSTSVAVKIRTWGYTGTTYIGRNANHNNTSTWSHSVPSTLTMMEIK
jgi:cyclophilin family peptidyl-prolyl cis-trans isomerase